MDDETEDSMERMNSSEQDYSKLLTLDNLPLRRAKSVAAIRQAFLDNLTYIEGRFFPVASINDLYTALAYTIRERIMYHWAQTSKTYLKEASRTICYLSAEFLLGPQLGTNINKLGLNREVRTALEDLGLSLDELLAEEPEPGLGNGGLGRLAACYLDSLATLNIPAIGYGIRYEFGMFNQEICDGWQVEKPDRWLRFGNPWEIAHPDITFEIEFGGYVEHYYDSMGNYRVAWHHDYLVNSTAYDIPILGFRNATANFLRLWKAEAGDAAFDLTSFNSGDYSGAVQKKVLSENLTKVLYPNDEKLAGKKLRLKQQYFFVASSLRDMIRIYLQRGKDLGYFHKKYAIQLNDTHPAIGIAELMRLFVDQYHLPWEEAWEITTKSFAYTNHTLLPEALEKWSLPLFAALLPRHLEIIYEINRRFLDEIRYKFGEDLALIRQVSVIEEGETKQVRMAHLACIGSHTINGVSKLHSDLLKQHVLQDFYRVFPEKFTNVTNGVTPRRFIKLINPQLSSLIDRKIGRHWLLDLTELAKLEKYLTDRDFLNDWQTIKLNHKERFAKLLKQSMNLTIDPHSLFDIQAKRIHEYKRQHLKLLHILSLYLQLKEHPEIDIPNRTFIFAGKAAPGYYRAKLLIKLINDVAKVINRDPTIQNRIKVVFFPNYNVKNSSYIYPAADLSEQISTAGKEASGTGNMKFALNGALTIGTLDGANIEMREVIGADNFFLFGLTADEVAERKAAGYHPEEIIANDPELSEIIKLLRSKTFNSRPEIFNSLIDSFVHHDEFMVCADFRAYLDCQRAVDEAFRNQESWTQKSLLNCARMGYFSSDRAIQEYCQNIWHIDPIKIKES